MIAYGYSVLLYKVAHFTVTRSLTTVPTTVPTILPTNGVSHWDHQASQGRLQLDLPTAFIYTNKCTPKRYVVNWIIKNLQSRYSTSKQYSPTKQTPTNLLLHGAVTRIILATNNHNGPFNMVPLFPSGPGKKIRRFENPALKLKIERKRCSKRTFK